MTPHRRTASGLAALTTALATALALTGCGSVARSDSAQKEAGAGYPVTVDDCGRQVTVANPPERVVSMHPSITELLIRLDVGDRVVAQAQSEMGGTTEEYADEVAAVPTLSKDTPPDKETLIKQEPDLVLSGTEYEFNTEMGFAGYDDLAALEIPAYTATAGCEERRSDGTVEDVFTDLAFLGDVFGKQEKAAELEKEAKVRLQEVADRVGSQEPVRTALVYVEAGTLYAIGGAVETDILRRAGGVNVFADDEGLFSDFFSAEVNPEVVLAEAPDAFVFSVNSADHEQQTRDYLTRTFPETDAVRDDRLVAVDNTFVQPGTLASVDGVEVVARGLHP